MDSRNKLYFSISTNSEWNKRINQIKFEAEKHGFIVTPQFEEANIIVSVGGDGEFLQTVRKAFFSQESLFIGITEAKDSLYCDFAFEHIDDFVESLKQSQLEVRKYPLLEVYIDDFPQPFYCLNECSIRSGIIKTFAMDVLIDDFKFETFRGDGLVISTPTGSTGYNKSVNGAVVDPMLPCFQVTELASLNNNQYRTLGASFICSGKRELELQIIQDGNDFPLIAMDNEALGVQHIKTVKIKLSDKKIKTIKLKNNSYWEKVQRMFL